MVRKHRTEQEGLEAWKHQTGRQPGDPAAAKAIPGGLNHGIFAFRMFGEEEKALFSEIIHAFLEEFKLNHSVDFVQLELVGIYSLQLMRAVARENWEAAERVDRMLRRHLDDLKVTKRAREGDGPADNRTSPMALAMSLLERAKARQAEEDTAASGKTPESLQRTPEETSKDHA